MNSNNSFVLRFQRIKRSNSAVFTIVDFAVFFIYAFLSSFETYLVPFIGNITKYIMVLIILLYLIKDFIIKGVIIDSCSICLLLWLGLKLLSIFTGGFNEIVELHYVSQFGFVLFILPFLMHEHRNKDKRLLLLALWLVSFIFNFLSLIFNKAYLTVYVSRHVLTLFNQQNDPNNCAAISLIGVAISLYVLIYKKKYLITNSISILIGSIAIIISGSRAGVLSLAAVVVISILFKKPLSTFRISIRVLSLIGIGILLFFILYLVLPRETFLRLFATFDDGGSSRLSLWKSALRLFMSSPFFGAGWGTATWYGKTFPTAVHNTFISMLAENGIIGLILFLLPWFIISKKAIKERNLLPILILLTAFIAAFFIDSINKRFIWNSIIASILALGLVKNSNKATNKKIIFREIDI